MKSVLLCRVSSKEQEETGYSLPAQEKLLTEYSNQHGLETNPKVFSISESASGKKQREIFSSMLVYISKHNIKIIICEKVDRLTRNFRDAVAINDWLNEDFERQVHFVKENVILTKDSKSNEKFIWNIKVSVAQYYIDNLSEEVKKGQREKIAEGWLPTKPPLGYKTVGEKGHKIHVVDEVKAPLIRRMFEYYAGGNYSIKKLAEKMYEEGLRNLGGSKLVKSRVHTLLTDPFYIGKIRWNDNVYEGKHETLISKEVFDRVQQLLKSKTTPKYSKHNFVFKGLIRCAGCKGLITWETAKGHIYGHCNHYRNCPQETWVKEGGVEQQLIELFDGLKIQNTRMAEWIKKALKESHKDEIEYRTTTIGELYSRREQITQRLDRLYDDKLDQKISPELYERKRKQYESELEDVNNTIKAHDSANIKYYDLGLNIYDLSQKAKDIYLKAKLKGLVEQQRGLLRLMFTDIMLDEGKLGYDYTPAFNLLYKAVDATNGSKMAGTAESLDKIFEPSKKIETPSQIGDFYFERSTLLER